MSTPKIEIITTDGKDTMPTMVEKVNTNFQELLEYVSSVFESGSVITLVLSAEDWVGDSPPFTQRKPVTVVSGDVTKQIIMVEPIVTPETINVIHGAEVSCTTQEAGVLGFSASLYKPTIDLVFIVVANNIEGG